MLGINRCCSTLLKGFYCMDGRFPHVFIHASPLLSLHALPEHGGQRSHLHHLLPPLQGDATGQAAQQGGGHQDAAVDFHQVLPGADCQSVFKHMIKLENALWCVTASTSQ